MKRPRTSDPCRHYPGLHTLTREFQPPGGGHASASAGAPTASTDIGVNSTRETNAAADLLSAGRSEHDG